MGKLNVKTVFAVVAIVVLSLLFSAFNYTRFIFLDVSGKCQEFYYSSGCIILSTQAALINFLLNFLFQLVLFIVVWRIISFILKKYPKKTQIIFYIITILIIYLIYKFIRILFGISFGVI